MNHPSSPSPGAAPDSPPAAVLATERKIIFLLAAVQFVNILDFMMVMPLGPDFASALGIPTSQLGIIGGSYTAAAAVAGLVGSTFLHRFDRRRALAVAMLGLVIGTAGGGFARDYESLVATRVIAGLFGGPATSIALAILTDVIPSQRRGRAMGAVMGAFSVASVLGVPFGLRLSIWGGWQLPFFAVAGLGVLVVLAVFVLMPPQRAHLGRGHEDLPRSFWAFLRDPLVSRSYLASVAAFLAVFAVIPNIATYFQYNLGFPRERLDLLYFIGGTMSFFAMRAGGAVVDRKGPLPAIWFGAVLLVVLFIGGFVPEHSPIPVPVIFVGFMLGNSVRMVGLHTLTSKIPSMAERARFMSTQSAVQHLSSALGAALSSAVLVERPDHGLQGMAFIALIGAALALALPFLVMSILRRLGNAGTPVVPAAAVAAK